jgi:hypothetical protein
MFHENEDEMDEFIRQAYADGMLNDDSHIAPNPSDYNPSLLSYNTTQPSTTTNRIPTPIDESEELILLSDDDDNDNHSSHVNIHPPSSTISYDQTSHLSSTIPSPPPPPPPLVQPPVMKISLPYTYLSLVRHPTFSSNTTYQDFQIKGCFSSLASNPRLIKNEFDLQAYVNDGSDCILIRLASDLLVQRIGITVTELLNKRRECKTDFDKQKFQTDFNERLKKFGHCMQHLYAIMTIRFFSDNNQIPMVINIDET